MNVFDKCFINVWEWVFTIFEPIFPKLFVISVHHINPEGLTPEQFEAFIDSLATPKHSWWTLDGASTSLDKGVVVFKRAIPWTTRSGERILISGRPPMVAHASVVHFQSQHPSSKDKH